MLFSNSPQLLSHNGAATIFSNCDCQNIHCATLPHSATTELRLPRSSAKSRLCHYICYCGRLLAANMATCDMRHVARCHASQYLGQPPAGGMSPCLHVAMSTLWPTAHWENLGHKEGIFYCLMCLLSMMQHTIIHLCMMALFSSDLNHIFSDRLRAFRWCSGTHLGQAAAASRIQI